MFISSIIPHVLPPTTIDLSDGTMKALKGLPELMMRSFIIVRTKKRSLLVSCLSASLGGERQRVWNFRGVCHCRDVARGSDRMISLCISWALLSLSNIVPMVPQSVEISTSVLSLYPYNMVPTMVYRVAFLYEIYRQRQSRHLENVPLVELVI